MREHYLGGREHAAIKHFFLRQYLEALAFKTLQVQDSSNQFFAYVDGFTGPWGAKDDEHYSDTSFGVALDVLKRVKADLPSAKIFCVFCEARRNPFLELKKYVDEHSDGMSTKCVHGRFEDNISDIVNFVGRRGFLFAFIDPKGWKVDAAAITPLLKDRWSEVVFTFMAEFIGRFPDYDKVEDAYATLLGDVDWKNRFESTPSNLSNDERVLHLFRGVIKDKWGFSHVLELPIQKISRDRVFYKLVYGTRSPYGVLTFRDAQAKAEREGIAVSIQAENKTQPSLFTHDEEAGHIAAAVGVSSRKHIAKLNDAILAILSRVHELSFLQLTADVLEEIPAREKDVKTTLLSMRDAGHLRLSGLTAKGAVGRSSIVTLVT